MKPTEVDSMNRLRVEAENRASALKEENERFREVFKDLLSVRDQFALAAMQAMIGTAAAPCLGGLDGYEPHTAKAAYKMADAMLAARTDGVPEVDRG